MGQPRPEGTSSPDPGSPAWVADLIVEIAKRMQTPAPAQIEQPPPALSEEPEPQSLKQRAEQLRQEALEQGRATPRPAAQPEQGTQAETPEDLARYREAGRDRARARLARISEQSLEGPDSRGTK